MSFVWNTLIDQEDVRVAVLTPIEEGGEGAEGEGGERAAEGERENVASTSALGEEQEEEKPKKSKGNAKKAAEVGKPTHSLVPVEGVEKLMGRQALIKKYGDGLRIAVSLETSWVAIVGSHERVRFNFRLDFEQNADISSKTSFDRCSLPRSLPRSMKSFKPFRELEEKE